MSLARIFEVDVVREGILFHLQVSDAFTLVQVCKALAGIISAEQAVEPKFVYPLVHDVPWVYALQSRLAEYLRACEPCPELAFARYVPPRCRDASTWGITYGYVDQLCLPTDEDPVDHDQHVDCHVGEEVFRAIVCERDDTFDYLWGILNEMELNWAHLFYRYVCATLRFRVGRVGGEPADRLWRMVSVLEREAFDEVRSSGHPGSPEADPPSHLIGEELAYQLIRELRYYRLMDLIWPAGDPEDGEEAAGDPEEGDGAAGDPEDGEGADGPPPPAEPSPAGHLEPGDRE